jgi:RND family efflux transporter MFP subunit
MFIRVLAAMIGLAAAGLLTACGPEEVSRESLPLKQVATIAVTESSGYEQLSSYTGRVEALLDSALGFEVGGLLSAVRADEGRRVAKGELLARLDTARLKARRAEAAAALDSVRADLKLAESTLERTQDAFSYKGVSRQQLDEARQQVTSLQAGERVAAARLDSIDVDLAKAELRAPFNGVVTGRFADPGVVLNPGQPVMQLQSDQPPEVRIGVAPDVAAELSAGDSYELLINAGKWPAKLKTVIPRRDVSTRTVDALFELTEASAAVRPGDLARLDTTTRIDTHGFWVPLTALMEGPRGLWQVLVAEAQAPSEDVDYRLVTRTLEVLYADGNRAYVRGTLAAGDLMVSDGLDRVVQGQAVKLSGVSAQDRVATTPMARGEETADVQP